MEKLDLKDRKILYHLDINSRQSFSQIGKKIGLHKDSVALRVKKLQERRIIKNFYSDINNFKLGYIELRFYLTLQYVTPDLKNDIIDYFVNNNYTTGVHSAEGHYDLIVVAMSRNIIKFSYNFDKILHKYKEYFGSQVYSTVTGFVDYEPSFLLNDKRNEQSNRMIHKRYDEGIILEIDDLDYSILKILNNNARIPIIEIAQKTESSVDTVKNRIKRLVKLDVIQAFRVNINYPKIGYKKYKVDVALKDLGKAPKIIKYIEKNPNLINHIKSIGYKDLELVFVLKNADQLHQIMGTLSKKFLDSVKNYIYFSVTKSHKYQWFPDK